MEKASSELDPDTASRSKRAKVDTTINGDASISHIFVDKEFLDNIVAFVKKNRERALTSAE